MMSQLTKSTKIYLRKYPYLHSCRELDELNGYIETQPACYQIANYNVHPAPTLCLEKTITGSVNVGVTLVEASSHIEVSTG